MLTGPLTRRPVRGWLVTTPPCDGSTLPAHGQGSGGAAVLRVFHTRDNARVAGKGAGPSVSAGPAGPPSAMPTALGWGLGRAGGKASRAGTGESQSQLRGRTKPLGLSPHGAAFAFVSRSLVRLFFLLCFSSALPSRLPRSESKWDPTGSSLCVLLEAQPFINRNMCSLCSLTLLIWSG